MYVKITYILDGEYIGEVIPQEDLIFKVIELTALKAEQIVFEGLTFED